MAVVIGHVVTFNHGAGTTSTAEATYRRTVDIGAARREALVLRDPTTAAALLIRHELLMRRQLEAASTAEGVDGGATIAGHLVMVVVVAVLLVVLLSILRLMRILMVVGLLLLLLLRLLVIQTAGSGSGHNSGRS